MLDPESLKAVGVATIGQRLTILKAIYQAKLAYHIPIDSDHYVPPCTYHLTTRFSRIQPCLAAEVQECSISVEKLNDLVREQGWCLSFTPSVLVLIFFRIYSSACFRSRRGQQTFQGNHRIVARGIQSSSRLTTIGTSTLMTVSRLLILPNRMNPH